MRTYVVFDWHTGNVVHTHVEDDAVRSAPEDLLALVDPAHDRKGLRVLEVAGLRPGESCRVNVGTNTLERTEGKEPASFGAASIERYVEGTLPGVKIVHEKPGA